MFSQCLKCRLLNYRDMRMIQVVLPEPMETHKGGFDKQEIIIIIIILIVKSLSLSLFTVDPYFPACVYIHIYIYIYTERERVQ